MIFEEVLYSSMHSQICLPAMAYFLALQLRITSSFRRRTAKIVSDLPRKQYIALCFLIRPVAYGVEIISEGALYSFLQIWLPLAANFLTLWVWKVVELDSSK